MSLHPRFACRLGLIGVLLLAPIEASERFAATAAVNTSGAAAVPLTIVIDKFSSDGERASLIKALKEGASARDLLAKRPAVGLLQIGTRSTPIKYAYAVSTDAKRLITVVTGSPIMIDAAGRAPQPQAGFDLGLVLLDLPSSGPGTGELVPATKIHVEQDNTIVTDHASPDLIKLSNVTARK